MKFFKVVFSFIIIFSFFLFSGKVYAYYLPDYIAGTDFIEHSLSTGESIYFLAEGGGIRQYKNTNYEQFILKSSGIYRREDTSWAPRAGYQDAHCQNGNKAIYTLAPGCINYSPGKSISLAGIYWAPNNAFEGDEWYTETHQVVPVDSTQRTNEYDYSALPPLRYCSLSDLGGYEYPSACGQRQLLKLLAHYAPEEFTFCTGATNPDDLIVIRVMSGPGGPVGGDPDSGDTFYFMRGWGLVAFETGPSDNRFEAGLSGGPGVIVGERHPPRCAIQQPPEDVIKVRRTIIGRLVTATSEFDEDGVEKSIRPIEGAHFCVYQGEKNDANGGLLEYIPNFEVSGSTREDGYFSIDTWLRFRPEGDLGVASYDQKYNFMGIFCGNDLQEIVKVDLHSLQRSPLPSRYYSLLDNLDFRGNQTVLTPIELMLNCPSQTGAPSFAEDGDPDTLGPAEHHVSGATDSSCPEVLPYIDRSEEGMLVCDGQTFQNNTALTNTSSIERTTTSFLLQPHPDPSKIGKRVENVPSRDMASKVDQGTIPEGRWGVQGFGNSNILQVKNLMHALFGGLSLGPHDLPRGNRGNSGYSCEVIRQGNKTLPSTKHGPSIQNTKGTIVQLSMPYDRILEKLYEGSAYFNGNPYCYSSEYGKVTVGQVQAPSYVGEWQDHCAPGSVNPVTDEPCDNLLSLEYFDKSIAYRTFYAQGAATTGRIMDSTTNDSYDTEGRVSRWITSSDENPQLDQDNTDGCDGEEFCGARSEYRILNPSQEGLTSAATGLMLSGNTTPFAGTTEGMAPLKVLASPSEYVRNENRRATYTSSGHKLLLGVSNCLTNEIDGHNMYPVNWRGPVPLEPASNEEGALGSYNAHYDFVGGLPDGAGGWAEVDDEHDFAGVSYTTPFGSFLRIFEWVASFFADNGGGTADIPDECKHTASSPVDGCLPDSTTCYCAYLEDGSCDGDPCDNQEDPGCGYVCCESFEEFECTGDVNSFTQIAENAVDFRVDASPFIGDAAYYLQAFLMPSSLRVTPHYGTECVTESFSSAVQATNNDQGYGNTFECTVEATNIADKVREMVRTPASALGL